MQSGILYRAYKAMNKNCKGMTLIEVMIALAIFSAVAVFAVMSTRTGMNIRSKVSDENDYYHTARTVLRHMQKDISLAFHSPLDTRRSVQYRQTLPQFDQYQVFSFFRGTKDSILFSSSSHRRMYKDTNETDTCEISYTIETDQKDSSKNNLVKRESPFIDDKIEEGGAKYILAEGVEELRFRYLRPKIGEMEAAWVDRWDSTQGEFLYLFPVAVEVSMELISPTNKEKKIRLLQKIKILNPNNIDLGTILSGGTSS